MYPIKRKSHVLPVFEKFKVQEELEIRKIIKHLRIDSVGEYVMEVSFNIM